MSLNMFISLIIILLLNLITMNHQSLISTTTSIKSKFYNTRLENINSEKKLNCSTILTREVIQIIVDYAAWRKISMLYFLDHRINSGCNIKTLKNQIKCFTRNGLRISLQKNITRNFYLKKRAAAILVISFLDEEADLENYSKQFHHQNNDMYFHWLNIYSILNNRAKNDKFLLEKLGNSKITLSIHLVLAIVIPTSSVKNIILKPFENCKRTQQLIVNNNNKERAKPQSILPFNQTLISKNSTYNTTFMDICGNPLNPLGSYFCIIQAYKIRTNDNTSLVLLPLGFWSYDIGMDKLKNYQSVEKRRDFHKLPLILGKLDGTKETKQLLNKDMENWNKFAEYIILYLNSTQIDKTYAAIGEKTTSGNWSGLIGAIIAEDVDIVLDNIVKDPKMYSDIAFTQDIMVADRNIYLKPQQSNHVRDIFLTPFEPELLLYVILAGFLLAFVMALHLLTDLTNKYSLISKIYKYLQILSDASFCIIGIFTMQGTQIKPKSSSGKIIILISLLFSLVIYNSYSAFITSMLSVKLNKIRTVSDLLKSEDYQIGYTKNSEDENFLRTYNDTELNQIYLKGYLKNNINNITEGLLKATEGNYGFFASGYVARRQLLIISGYRCKYDITEIPALHTKNKIAFPMAPNSPYGKIINLCLIRMRESGIHQYVNSLIAPQLPKCDKKSSYQSARINDIVAAIGIFYVGVFFGGLIFVFECIWRNKKKIMYTVNRTCVFFNQNLEFVN